MMLISFIPLVLLSVISIRYLNKSLEEETTNQCKELAAEVKLQIDAYLDRPLNAVRVISSNSAVQSLDIAQTKSFLIQIKKAYPDISFTLDDVKGNQIARADNAKLVNVGDRAYFQAALQGNESISEPVVSKTDNKFTVMVGIPVHNPDSGATVGVMQGAFTLSKISDFVTKLSTDGTVAYVIDNTGKILAHPEESFVKDRVDMSDINFVKAGLSEKKSGFSIIDDLKSGKKLVTYVYDDRTGWLICLEVPYDVITAKTHTLSLVLGLITFVILVLVGLIVFYIAKKATIPLLKLQAAAVQISRGDLTGTVDISTHDEIGLLAKAFNQMMLDLKELVGTVQSGAVKMASSAEELTASTEQSASAVNQVAVSISTVAQGADHQLSAVNETSGVVTNMSRNIEQVAVNATKVTEQSIQATETAQQGGKAIENAITQIRGLEQTVSASARIVTQLGERSQEIGQIVDTISGIAGQTNLLALNAAIEAARAGEQGRGFAVVAEEVRKLAEQSQSAAKKIAEMIGEIQQQTSEAVESMNGGTREVSVSADVVNEAGHAFQEIIDLIAQLSDQIGRTSTATDQMASSSKQIVSAVEKIDQLIRKTTGETQTVSAATEEQSASMEEIAASSQSLAKLAQALQDEVHKFHIG